MDKVTDQDYEGALVIVTDSQHPLVVDDDRLRGLSYQNYHPNDDAYGTSS